MKDILKAVQELTDEEVISLHNGIAEANPSSVEELNTTFRPEADMFAVSTRPEITVDTETAHGYALGAIIIRVIEEEGFCEVLTGEMAKYGYSATPEIEVVALSDGKVITI